MIYFDNASTTITNNDVLEEYNKETKDFFYNASSLNKHSVAVSNKIQAARENIIKQLGGSFFDKFVFTSCATESNNLAISSFVRDKSSKMLFSISEHPSVYECAIQLKNTGYNVEFVNVDQNGHVDFSDFKLKLTTDVKFVSIIHVNNETGVVNDIAKFAEYTKSFNPKIIFHSDGVQAFGKIAVDLLRLGVDLYSVSSHKIYGTKGIGGLFAKKGINLKPQLLGGGQEFGLRSGTENNPAIFAFDKACENAASNQPVFYEHVTKLKNHLHDQLHEKLDGIIKIVGANTSPYITMIILKDCRGETILHMLEEYDIIVGLGSACSSKKTVNRNLNAIGFSAAEQAASLRISFSYSNTLEEIDRFVQKLQQVYFEYINKVNR